MTYAEEMQCTSTEVVFEEANEKGGQDPDLMTAAIRIHYDQMCSISHQLSRPAKTTNSFAIGSFGRASSTSCRVMSASRAALGRRVEGCGLIGGCRLKIGGAQTS